MAFAWRLNVGLALSLELSWCLTLEVSHQRHCGRMESVGPLAKSPVREKRIAVVRLR